MMGDGKWVPEECFRHCCSEGLLFQEFLPGLECQCVEEGTQNELKGLCCLDFLLGYALLILHS